MISLFRPIVALMRVDLALLPEDVDLQSVVRALLEVDAGTRTHRTIFDEALRRGDLGRAATMLGKLRESDAEACKAALEERWSAARSDVALRREAGERELIALRQHNDISEVDEAEVALQEAQKLYERVPEEAALLPRDFEPLLTEVFLWVDIALDAVQRGKKKVHQREEERKQKLLTIKREADALLGEIAFQALESQDEADLALVQSELLASYRRRDVIKAEQLVAWLRALSLGDKIPLDIERTPPAAAPAPRPAPTARFSLDYLSKLSLARLAEGRDQPIEAVASAEEVLFDVSSWEIPILEQTLRSARARYHHASTEQERWEAIGGVLFADAKLHLAQGNPAAARTLFADTFQWCAAFARGEEVTAACLLASLARLLRSDEGDKRGDMVIEAHPSHIGAQLRWLEERGFLGEPVSLAAAMTRRASEVLFDRFLWPIIKERPQNTEQCVTRLIADAVEGARGPNAAPSAITLLMRLLQKLVPGLTLVEDPLGDIAEIPVAETLRRLSLLLDPIKEESVYVSFTKQRLDEDAKRLTLPRRPEEVIHRLLTREIVLGATRHLIVEIYVERGAPPLRFLRPSAELSWAQVEQRLLSPTLARVEPGEVHELSFDVSKLDLKPGPGALRVQELQITNDGKSLAVPARLKELSLLIREPAKVEQRANNPFKEGEPIRDIEHIFGREEDIKKISSYIDSNVIVLNGPRAIGKTTLLNAIERRDDMRSRFVIVRDSFQNARSAASLSAVFGVDRADILRSALERAGVMVQPIAPARFQENPAEAFRLFMGEADQALARRGRKMLLLIDELDRAIENEALCDDILTALREVIVSAHNMRFVLSGASEVLNRSRHRRESRLFNLGMDMTLSSLDDTGARRLIREAAKPHFELTRSAMNLVLAETSRQPYLLQAVGLRLFDRMQQRASRTATLTDTREVLLDMARDTRLFRDFHRSVPSDDDHKIVQALSRLQLGNSWVQLSDIQRELSHAKLSLDRDTLVNTMLELIQAAPLVVEERLTTRAYRLRVGLYARHLRLLRGDQTAGVWAPTQEGE